MSIINRPEENYLAMTNRQSILNLLGIARRAGELISGEDTVLKAIRSQKVQLVLIASDAGKTTSKKFQDKCHYYQVPFDITFEKQQLNTATGQARTVYGITQYGFAHKIEELLHM